MDERYDAEALRRAREAAAAGETVLWAGPPASAGCRTGTW